METQNQENALNVTEQEQAPVETQTTETTPESVTQEAETATAETVQAEPENEGELKPWMKDRLARANRKAERFRQEAELAKMQLQSYGYQQTQQHVAPQNQQQQPIEPSQLNEETVLSLVQKAQARQQQQQAQIQYEAAKRAFYDNLTHGHDKFEDFEEVTQSVAFTEAMRDAILDLKDPDTFVYSLAKNNPQRLAEIARLNPIQQIREMGELVAEYKSKIKPKLVSKAPAPPSTQPKSSAGSAATPKPEDMSPSEYVAYLRQKRQNQSRR